VNCGGQDRDGAGSALLCAQVGPNAGTCVVDNCFNIPCPGSQICVNFACVDNPCQAMQCSGPGQYCRPSSDFKTATCATTCAGVSCPGGMDCVSGACVTPPCPGGCASGQVCAGPDGASDGGNGCVPSKCLAEGGSCPNGGCCNPLTGACGTCPCTGIVCPTGQTCVDNECIAAIIDAGVVDAAGETGGRPIVDAAEIEAGGSAGSGGVGPVGGSGGSVIEVIRGRFGLATGGGGCSCETGPGLDGRAGRFFVLGLALFAAAARRRRRHQASASRNVVSGNGDVR